ncbi:hypothetical protein B0A52_03925 [Exophiala mesophila]|uniref:Xylanolytic transcriptional activator regulatory domain-containing protein n=1 Tax=Exophiala mesophila TaxID=212818 RepID=A0A438N7L5_EXOME|nr:hypothetical protein B0A52_03925 [Exophiala mesophila]
MNGPIANQNNNAPERAPRRKRQKRIHPLPEVPSNAKRDGDLSVKSPRLNTESTSSPSSPTSDIDVHVVDVVPSDPSAGTKEPVSFDQVSPDDPQAYVERVSSVGFTQQIIDSFSPDTVLVASTSALPGGIRVPEALKSKLKDEIPLDKVVGFELPPKKITDYLLDSYLDTVHWFMCLFHAPTLRVTYETLMTSRRCPRSRSNQVIFILVLLWLGARYANVDDVRRKFPNFDLDKFETQALKGVEDNMNGLYEAAGLEAVQVCSLLGSYYVYNGRPNLGFIVLGAGLRCAQLMNLHKESSWRKLPDIVKEDRRRTFWALYILDCFCAMTYGRPQVIVPGEMDVKFPANIGDSNITHPAFRSTARMPDGSVEKVTTFSYVKYKVKLYQISSSLIGDVYFHRSSNIAELASRVSRIHDELVSFRDSLPPEMNLEELCRDPTEPATDETRPFLLQALALQIAYDNIQILLHRPLFSQDLRHFKPSGNDISKDPGYLSDGNESLGGGPEAKQDVHDILVSSRDNCWESAIRSSKLGKYRQPLLLARERHAAAFLGINLFTAGMVLCVVALSRPLSSQAQIAKQAVARIMSLSRFLSTRVNISGETTKILKDLVRLIGNKEIKAMLADAEMLEPESKSRSNRPSKQTSSRTTRINETRPVTSTSQQGSLDDLPNAIDLNSMDLQPVNNEILPDFGTIDTTLQFPGFENMDFNNGIYSLQQAMFPPSTNPTPETAAPVLADGAQMDPWNVESYNNGNTTTQAPFSNDSVGSESGGLMGSDPSLMNTMGQTWLWDSFSPNVSWNNGYVSEQDMPSS